MERQCRYIFLRAETAFYVIVGVKNPLNKNWIRSMGGEFILG
jgi:hypothetical protein